MSTYAAEIVLKARDEASAPLKSVGGAADQLRGTLSSLASTVASGFGMGIGMEFGQKFTDAIRTAATAGFEFNKTMEDTKTGIAAILLSNMEFTNSAGGAATAQERINIAMDMAGGIQEKLKIDALGTSASYQDLAKAFQTTVGPAFAAGVTNLDKVREITVQATQAMTALGIPTRQASQEIKAMFTGEQGPDNQLNQQLRITKAEIEAVKRSGQDLGEYYLTKLAPFADMAAEASKNFSTRLSNLGDAFDQVMGQATKPIFEAFKSAISDLTGDMSGFQGRLNEIGVKIGELVQAVAPYIPKLVDFGIALLGVGVDFLSSMTPLLPVLAEVLDKVQWILEAIGPLGISVLAGAAAFGKITAAGGLMGSMLTGLGTFLSGSLMGTLGVFIVTLGVVAAALHAVSLAMDLKREEAAVKSSYQNMASTMVTNLSRMQAAHPELTSRVTALKAEIIKLQSEGGAAVEKASGKLTSEFNAIAKSARDSAPPIEGVTQGLNAIAKAPALDPKQAEAVKKLGEEHDKVKTKIEAHIATINAPAGTTAYEKLRQTAAIELGKIRKEFGDSSDLIALREQQLTVDLQAEAMKQAAHHKAVPIQIAQSWEENNAKALASVQKFGTNLVIVLDQPTEDLKAYISDAWLSIGNGIRDQFTGAGDFVKGIWSSMAGGLDQAFGDAFTGKIVNIGETLKGVFAGIQKNFADLVSDMIQRWAAGKETLSRGLAGLEGALHPFQGSGGLATAGNAAVGGVAGYGFGSMVGSVSGAPGWSTGASTGGALGGAIGSVIPGVGTVIGMVVGAIIGGIIGAIAAPNTEAHVSAQFKEMLDKSTTNAFAAAGRKVLESQQNWMVGLFELGGKEAGLSAAALTKSYSDEVKKLLTGSDRPGAIGFAEISAGSSEDIQKGLQRFLQENLPRLAMQAAFGQTGYGPSGNRDREGGQAGLNWWIGWMDGDGNVIKQAQQLFDPGAPIPMLLDKLGFTGAKITELAKQLIADDPGQFKKRLESLVGLVVDVNKALKSYGGGRGGIESELNARAGQTTTSYFAQTAQDIADAAKAMESLTGDEALARARQIAAASNQRYEEELQAIQRIRDLATSISASIASQREDLYVRQLDTGGKTNYFQAQINALLGELGKATTEGQVQSIVQQIQKFAGSLTDIAFSGESPNTALINWIDQILGTTDLQAQTKLSTFIDDIVGTNDALQGVLEDLKLQFTDVTDATDYVATSAAAAGDGMTGVGAQANAAAEALGTFADAVAYATAILLNNGNGTDITAANPRDRRITFAQVGA